MTESRTAHVLVVGGRKTNFRLCDDLEQTGRFTFTLDDGGIKDRAVPAGTQVVFLTRWRPTGERGRIAARARKEGFFFVDLDTATGQFNDWSERVLGAFAAQSRAESADRNRGRRKDDVPHHTAVAQSAPTAPVEAPAPISEPVAEAVPQPPTAPVAAEPVAPPPAPKTRRGELQEVFEEHANLELYGEAAGEEIRRLFEIARGYGLSTTMKSVANGFSRLRKRLEDQKAAAEQTAASSPTPVESSPMSVDTTVEPPLTESIAPPPAPPVVEVAPNQATIEAGRLLDVRVGELRRRFDADFQALEAAAKAVVTAAIHDLREGARIQVEGLKRQVHSLQDELGRALARMEHLEGEEAIERMRHADEVRALKAQLAAATLGQGESEKLRRQLELYARLEVSHPVIKQLRTAAEQLDALGAIQK